MRTTFTILISAALAAAAAHAQTAIALEAATDRAFYRDSGASTVCVQARVRTGAPDSGGAPARNIAFVLDCSGSMAGEPAQALRRAVVDAVASLQPKDVAAVVLFGSEVQTLVEAARREDLGDLEASVARLEPAGGAALYDALNQGAAQLRRFGVAPAVGHLVLVADGPATKGPRETDDFVRLAEAFAREGITLSTVGLGADFDEDLLASLARIGNGRFRFVDLPAKLPETLVSEIAPTRKVVGCDATLSIEFRGWFRGVESDGRESATVENSAVVVRMPRLYAGVDTSVLASGEIDAFVSRGALRDAVVVRLRWTGAEDGQPHELAKPVTLTFISDDRAVRESVDAEVCRALVGAIIGKGLREAIESIDKGDLRRAMRALRSARDEAVSTNFSLDDPEIDRTIRQLDAYIAEVRARGMSRLDRKILRSGLYNQFPVAAEDEL